MIFVDCEGRRIWTGQELESLRRPGYRVKVTSVSGDKVQVTFCANKYVGWLEDPKQWQIVGKGIEVLVEGASSPTKVDLSVMLLGRSTMQADDSSGNRAAAEACAEEQRALIRHDTGRFR